MQQVSGTTGKERRKELLMPNDIPKWLRVYDLGPEQFDRYTIVFTKLGRRFYFPYVNSSFNPYHPQGLYLHGESNNGQSIDKPSYGHLGKKITFKDLPEDVQKAVIHDYKSYWDIDYYKDQLFPQY